MKKTVPFLILMIVTTTFIGCKKYDEGPAFTLRTVKSRLTNGAWELQSLTVDGEDSTADYKEIDFTYRITRGSEDIGGKAYTYQQTYTHNNQLISVSGNIYFEKETKGETIIFDPYTTYGGDADFFTYSYNGNSNYYSYSSNSSNGVIWNITKLTNKEFWLETLYGRRQISMKLVKSN